MELFTPEERSDLDRLGTQRSYAKGEVLLRQGERSRHLIVLVRGRASVVLTTMEGRRLLLAIRGPGDALGELALFDGGPRLATVSALEPVTALSVPGEAFTRWLLVHPQVALRMLAVASRRLREADGQRVRLVAADVDARVARQLLELAARFGVPTDAGLTIDLALSQDDLAAAVGTSREAVNQSLARLRREGAVATQRMRISLCDVDALRSVAFGG